MAAETVFEDFTYPCKTCGATVTVGKGKTEPHRCRIDLDAQRKLR